MTKNLEENNLRKNDENRADAPEIQEPDPENNLKADLDWLKTFEARHGRPLRVLHIGNIAGNAYLNAKFLRSVGVEADVVSNDYTHVMAYPEWEEVELDHGHGDDFHPVFDKRDLHGFKRPEWFISGTLATCAAQVQARHDPRWFFRTRAKVIAWVDETTRRFLTSAVTRSPLGTDPSADSAFIHRLLLLITSPDVFVVKAYWRLAETVAMSDRIPAAVKAPLRRLYRSIAAAKCHTSDESGSPLKRRTLFARLKALFHRPDQTARNNARLIAKFTELFPGRKPLTSNEIWFHGVTTKQYSRMFKHYDIVQCYATNPIHALLANKRLYVAFEHGTLRAFTMGDELLHRLTALAYRMSDHTFITNGDCIAFAKRLGIPSYSAAIHPINVEQHRRDYGNEIDRLRRDIGGDVILFCPTRHDWDIKGTDRFIRALPLIKERVSGRVKLMLANWGAQVSDSKRLLEDLGCANDVVWKGTMSRITMIKHIQAADVVLDQMVLPAFGSTAPQTLAAGRPVVSSYRPEEMAWLFPEPAPILSAYSPEEIADAVVKALEPGWRAEFEQRARRWIDTYHHTDTVIRDHLRVYRRLLESKAGTTGASESE